MEKKLTTAVEILIFAAVILLLGARIGGSLLALLGGSLAIGLALFLGWVAECARRKENQKNPITTVEATVVSHRVETHRSRSMTTYNYYVTFRPEDGSPNVEFEVSEIDFDDFDIGETGPLRYRTWEFLSFNIPDRSDMKPIAPLPEEYEPAPDEITVEVDWEGTKARMNALKEKLVGLWARVKAQDPEELEEDSAVEKDDGILTHELDE